jgi:hypothetical protein
MRDGPKTLKDSCVLGPNRPDKKPKTCVVATLRGDGATQVLVNCKCLAEGNPPVVWHIQILKSVTKNEQSEKRS